MMRGVCTTALLMGLTLFLSTSCNSTLETYTCSNNSDCRSEDANGRCEESNVCSFADDECDSGRRYGKLSGDSSMECVLDKSEGVADAATIDAIAPLDIDADIVDADVADGTPEPDAEPACPAIVDLMTCPSAGCPGGEGTCCIYYNENDDTRNCQDICGALPAGVCLSAHNVGATTCDLGSNRSCGSKTTPRICVCVQN